MGIILVRRTTYLTLVKCLEYVKSVTNFIFIKNSRSNCINHSFTVTIVTAITTATIVTSVTTTTTIITT